MPTQEAENIREEFIKAGTPVAPHPLQESIQYRQTKLDARLKKAEILVAGITGGLNDAGLNALVHGNFLKIIEKTDETPWKIFKKKLSAAYADFESQRKLPGADKHLWADLKTKADGALGAIQDDALLVMGVRHFDDMAAPETPWRSVESRRKEILGENYADRAHKIIDLLTIEQAHPGTVHNVHRLFGSSFSCKLSKMRSAVPENDRHEIDPESSEMTIHRLTSDLKDLLAKLRTQGYTDTELDKIEQRHHRLIANPGKRLDEETAREIVLWHYLNIATSLANVTEIELGYAWLRYTSADPASKVATLDEARREQEITENQDRDRTEKLNNALMKIVNPVNKKTDEDTEKKLLAVMKKSIETKEKQMKNLYAGRLKKAARNSVERIRNMQQILHATIVVSSVYGYKDATPDRKKTTNPSGTQNAKLAI